MRHVNGMIALLVLALSFASCGEENGDSAGGGKAESARPTPLLKYRFEQGQKTHYLQTAKTALKSAMFNTKEEMIFDVIIEVVKPQADGAHQLTYTYDRVRMTENNPMAGGTVEYDSKAEDAAEKAGNPMVVAAVAIEGAVITLTQESSGKITSLTGMESVTGRLTKLVSENPAAANSAGKLKGMYTDEAWRKNLEFLTVVFPSETLEPGATWNDERKFPIPSLGEIGVSTTYTFNGSEDTGTTTVATLSYVSKFDLEGFKPPEADPNDPNPMAGALASLKITAGDVTGTITFDMEAGRIMTHENNLQMAMEVMTMQMQVEVKTTYELAE